MDTPQEVVGEAVDFDPLSGLGGGSSGGGSSSRATTSAAQVSVLGTSATSDVSADAQHCDFQGLVLPSAGGEPISAPVVDFSALVGTRKKQTDAPRS